MQLDLPGREFGLGSVRQNAFIFSSYRSWNPQPFCDTGFQLGDLSRDDEFLLRNDCILEALDAFLGVSLHG